MAKLEEKTAFALFRFYAIFKIGFSFYIINWNLSFKTQRTS